MVQPNLRRYRERMAIVEAEDWHGPRSQTCMNAGSRRDGVP
jgi:hypothetical protein